MGSLREERNLEFADDGEGVRESLLVQKELELELGHFHPEKCGHEIWVDFRIFPENLSAPELDSLPEKLGKSRGELRAVRLKQGESLLKKVGSLVGGRRAVVEK